MSPLLVSAAAEAVEEAAAAAASAKSARAVTWWCRFANVAPSGTAATRLWKYGGLPARWHGSSTGRAARVTVEPATQLRNARMSAVRPNDLSSGPEM